MTIDITGENDLPTAADNTVDVDEDVTFTFAVVQFGFADGKRVPSPK